MDAAERRKKAADPSYSILEDEEYLLEFRPLWQAIRDNKSKRLLTWARRLGIDAHSELPQDARDTINQLLWWDEDETEFIFFRTRLSFRGETRLSKIVKEKQYELAKKWTDLLAPMLSTVISILALLIAILALYLQAMSDPIIIVPPSN